jgi:hypothetical protein
MSWMNLDAESFIESMQTSNMQDYELRNDCYVKLLLVVITYCGDNILQQ